MSKKTSTAALESICEGRLPNRRRAPRHPAGGRTGKEVRRQRSNERAGEFGQALIAVRGEGTVNGNALRGAEGKFRLILPAILRITFCLAMWTLGAMTLTIAEAQIQEHRYPRDTTVGGTRIGKPARLADASHDKSDRASSEKLTRGFFE
jgi:hypothetical protein